MGLGIDYTVALVMGAATLMFVVPKIGEDRFEQGYEKGRQEKVESIESTEHQAGLIKLIAEKSGEALAVTGNGDGTTTTNNFGNIYDAALMEYVVGEQVPITFVDHLPKYGAQQ